MINLILDVFVSFLSCCFSVRSRKSSGRANKTQQEEEYTAASGAGGWDTGFIE